MDESVLWAVALGLGGVGFLILAVAGWATMVFNGGARGPRDEAHTGGPQPHADAASSKASGSQAADVSAPSKAQGRASSPGAEHRPAGGGFWVWLKAWVFALVHASTVSVVLGGMTFFEDLANASDEIRHTGTVTFPKQLLPGTLIGSASRKRPSEPSGGLLKDGHGSGDDRRNEGREDYAETGGVDPPGGSSSTSAGWEVVEPTIEDGPPHAGSSS